MGPWMRLGEIITTRKGAAHHFQQMMEDMKEREQKRIVEARILKEDALKLRATRILRFGRFAIRVPRANLTRYRDQPLAESYSEKCEATNFDPFASIRSFMSVSHYLPGQKHHGVMIPELGQSVERNLREKQFRLIMSGADAHPPKASRRKNFQSQIKKGFFKRFRANSFSSIDKAEVTCKEIKVLIAECVKESEQGFEVIPEEYVNGNKGLKPLDLIYTEDKFSDGEIKRGSEYIFDDRNDGQTDLRSEDNIESRCEHEDSMDLCITTARVNKSKVKFVMSDLTDNWS